MQERVDTLEEDNNMDENEEIVFSGSSEESAEESESEEVELELLDSKLATSSHIAKYIKTTYFAFKSLSDPMKIILNQRGLMEVPRLIRKASYG